MEKVFFKTSEAAASQSGAMEPETIEKNGRVRSQMSRGNFFRNACFAVLAAGVIIFACSAGVSQKSERWEYKTLWLYQHSDYDSANEEELNRLGAEGWELVSGVVTSYNTGAPMYILKRKL